jgi:hypothetical protein
MPARTPSGRDPAEGSRETVEHELNKAGGSSAAARCGELAPGDEVTPGTPGTGEDTCPQCRGSGKVDANSCPNCMGIGRIIKAIGGA